ncbi:MAG TPA: hypothetical protein VKN37_05605, partial [Roseovarius sp.]|nr:hypothetical protein [Roseovarius sp.]
MLRRVRRCLPAPSLETRIRVLEAAQARADERFLSVLQILDRIETQLERLEIGPQRRPDGGRSPGRFHPAGSRPVTRHTSRSPAARAGLLLKRAIRGRSSVRFSGA